jgi:hypothetical protein
VHCVAPRTGHRTHDRQEECTPHTLQSCQAIRGRLVSLD